MQRSRSVTVGWRWGACTQRWHSPHARGPVPGRDSGHSSLFFPSGSAISGLLMSIPVAFSLQAPAWTSCCGDSSQHGRRPKGHHELCRCRAQPGASQSFAGAFPVPGQHALNVSCPSLWDGCSLGPLLTPHPEGQSVSFYCHAKEALLRGSLLPTEGQFGSIRFCLRVFGM